MTVTIVVADEAGGVGSSKRACLHSDQFGTVGEFEDAVLLFIRNSSRANEASLDSFLPAGTREAEAVEARGR